MGENESQIFITCSVLFSNMIQTLQIASCFLLVFLGFVFRHIILHFSFSPSHSIVRSFVRSGTICNSNPFFCTYDSLMGTSKSYCHGWHYD